MNLSKFSSKIAKLSSKRFSEVKQKCLDHSFFSWSAQKMIDPLVMTKADGHYFWDEQGNKYFDFNSGLMCNNYGYNHPTMKKIMKEQIDEYSYASTSFATPIRAKASEAVANLMPGDLKKIFFTLGGAEANENAIKFAKHFTKRNKIIARYKSYHGATLGAISLTGDNRRWINEPGMPGVLRTFDTYKYRCPIYREGMTDNEYAEKLIEVLEYQIKFENPDDIAAIFIETVVGSNGLLIPPGNYLKLLRNLCDKYGILLVCDEVMCGFGRTGATMAVNHWDVVPDLITSAKGLTGGHSPLGMVAVSSKIAKEFEKRPFMGGLTYSCIPICMASAYASCKILKEENIVENSKKQGKLMNTLMLDLLNKHECVGDVRSIGLFGGIELVKNKKTKEVFVPYGKSNPEINEILGFMKKNGVYAINFHNVLYCNPPLTIKEDELKSVFKVIDEALRIGDKYCH